MRITKCGKYLLQLTRLFVFNCYLVREADGFTLIDSGLSGNAQRIIDIAKMEDVEIRRILLTHPHSDHVGSLDAIVAALPNVDLMVAERTARFLARDFRLLPDEPQSKLRGDFPTCTAEPTQTIAPGEKIGSLRVIATPGHTPDHVAFYDERDGTLIAGDAFQTQGGIAVAGSFVWRFPLPAFATWHPPTALQSAQHLLALSPTRLATGHGPVLEDPLTAMEQAIRKASANLNNKE